MRRYERRELVQRIKEANLTLVHVSSFVSLLLPLMMLQRWLDWGRAYRPESELLIQPWLNKLLAGVMQLEFQLIRLGISLPVGGSLLLVARRP